MAKMLSLEDTNQEGINLLLALARPTARFVWDDDHTHHRLYHTYDPSARLYDIKFVDPKSLGFLTHPRAGQLTTNIQINPYATIEVEFDNASQMKNASLVDLLTMLPALEIIRGKCVAFEFGRAYSNCEGKSKAKVNLYSKE